jgi:Integrase zinc binding domain
VKIKGRNCNTIIFKGKNYIPKDLELQHNIVKMYHNYETVRHPGELETYNGIRQNYRWPGLQMFVKNYVQGCGICQQFKINGSLSNPAYIAIEGANNTRPFTKCSIDLITNLPLVKGYNSILVVVDQGLLKGVILSPCAKTITWEGTNLTTAYHPQSDGVTKRVNQEIKAYLSIYCTSHPEDWLHSLSTLEFTHNNRRHTE